MYNGHVIYPSDKENVFEYITRSYWVGGVGGVGIGVFRTVVISAKFLTLWASVGAAVSAPVRLEVGDIAR